MRNFLPAFLCVCALAVTASSQQSVSQQSGQEPSKASSKRSTTPAATEGKSPLPAKDAGNGAPADYSQEAFVIEKLQNHYWFEADGTGRKESIARIRVQSEAGVQQWGQLQLGYNSANESMEIAYVRVIKKDGSVVKTGKDDIQDLSAPVEHEAPVYTDYRQKHVTVPGLRPGEVLEYDLVTTVHTALAPGQFWTEYEFDKNDIVLDEELDLDVPSGRPLELKSKPGMDPKITEANGRRVYHWTSS
ncbi:MAG: DUF3857 domain-containing protein, partial [Candidatus Sulfotelmatobacter sp.]